MTSAVKIAQSAAPGVTVGFRNRIINGAMQIWQRGTSFSASGSGYYTADRWQTLGQTGTYSQSSDAPTGFKNSLSISCTSTYYGTIAQRIEAQNSYDLAGQSVTVSFWAKATTGGASGLGIALDYANASDNFSSTTNFASTSTAALTSTWTKYTATFNSLNANVTNGLQLYIYNLAGGAAAITYLISGVQLEVGTSATNFDYRPYGTELALCQRYFEKSFDTETAPANGPNGTSVSTSNGVTVGWSTNSTFGGMYVKFQVAKRAVPTLTAYGNSSGYWYAGAWGSLAAYFNYVGTSGYSVTQQQTGGQNVVYGHWTASAEL